MAFSSDRFLCDQTDQGWWKRGLCLKTLSNELFEDRRSFQKLYVSVPSDFSALSLDWRLGRVRKNGISKIN